MMQEARSPALRLWHCLGWPSLLNMTGLQQMYCNSWQAPAAACSLRQALSKADTCHVPSVTDQMTTTPAPQANRQAGRQANRQAGRQTGKQAGRQTGRQANRQAGRQTGKKAGRQAGRLPMPDQHPRSSLSAVGWVHGRQTSTVICSCLPQCQQLVC